MDRFKYVSIALRKAVLRWRYAGEPQTDGQLRFSDAEQALRRAGQGISGGGPKVRKPDRTNGVCSKTSKILREEEARTGIAGQDEEHRGTGACQDKNAALSPRDDGEESQKYAVRRL